MISRRSLLLGALALIIPRRSLAKPRRKWIGGGDAGGGGGYVAKAVHFDGDTWLVRQDILNSIINSPIGIFSVWSKVAIPDNPACPFSYVVIDVDSNAIQLFSWVEQLSAPSVSLFGLIDTINTTAEYDLNAQFDDSIASSWHNTLFAWKTNEASGQKIGALYINDILQIPNVSDNNAAFSTDYQCGIAPASGGIVSFGASVRGRDGSVTQPFVGDASDFYFNTTQQFVENDGTILETTRRKFITTAGKPANPLGFPSSGSILFSGDASTFSINQGTGDAFTLTGTLTNATTSPSD